MYVCINCMYVCMYVCVYHIFSNKCWASNQQCPLVSAATLGIHIEISASPLLSAV